MVEKMELRDVIGLEGGVQKAEAYFANGLKEQNEVKGHTNGGIDGKFLWHRPPAVPKPAPRDGKVWRKGELQKGDKVEYYSNTHSSYMEAEVQDVLEKDDEVLRVDLSIKKRADPSKIRWPQTEPTGPEKRFEVNEKVEYWSESYGQYMAAVVKELREDGLYNLDVKNAAMPSRIRRRAETEAREVQRATRQPSAATKAASEASPVSSVSVGTPYRDLPASMLFLGTGTEGYKSRGTSRASVKTVSEGASPVISSVRGTGLYAGEIHMGDSFEPSEQPLMSQLLSELDISAAKIEAMTGFAGGLNDGVWFVSGSRQGKQEELVLKLVKCQRIASNVPTEAENLEKVYQQHPTISSDETLAFPSKIFSCVAPDGKRKHDLIIMRRVPGERLAEVICRKYWAKQEAMLRQIFESLGQQLALFHSRYNKQHGDFQPSNVFFDEASDGIFFIDIGGMGVPTLDNDVEHFCEAMGLLKGAYGPTLHEELAEAFRRGYEK